MELLGENATQSVVIEFSKGRLSISTTLLTTSHFQHTKWHKQVKSLTN